MENVSAPNIYASAKKIECCSSFANRIGINLKWLVKIDEAFYQLNVYVDCLFSASISVMDIAYTHFTLFKSAYHSDQRNHATMFIINSENATWENYTSRKYFESHGYITRYWIMLKKETS